MRVEEQERAYVNWIECPCRIEIVHVVTADALAVNVAFIFGQTDFVVVFMKCMGQTNCHWKQKAKGQNQANNLFASFTNHPATKIRITQYLIQSNQTQVYNQFIPVKTESSRVKIKSYS